MLAFASILFIVFASFVHSSLATLVVSVPARPVPEAYPPVLTSGYETAEGRAHGSDGAAVTAP